MGSGEPECPQLLESRTAAATRLPELTAVLQPQMHLLCFTVQPGGNQTCTKGQTTAECRVHGAVGLLQEEVAFPIPSKLSTDNKA